MVIVSSLFKLLGFSRAAQRLIAAERQPSYLKLSFKEFIKPLKSKLTVPLLASVFTVAVCECSTCQNSGGTSSCPDCVKPNRACQCGGAGGTCSCFQMSTGEQKPLQWEKQDLTHCYLLKQANVITTDAITRIMSETVSAFEDYHCQYRHLLEMLMDLMEDSRCAPDNRQELLNCKMIVIRSSIEDIKKSIVELECYLDSVSRLAHASAESAFLANAEYASIALMERLNSVMTKVKEIKDKTVELERSSNELHALVIVESGKGLK